MYLKTLLSEKYVVHEHHSLKKSIGKTNQTIQKEKRKKSVVFFEEKITHHHKAIYTYIILRAKNTI